MRSVLLLSPLMAGTLFWIGMSKPGQGQDQETSSAAATQSFQTDTDAPLPDEVPPEAATQSSEQPHENAESDKTNELVSDAQQKIEELAQEVDANPTAKKAAEGLLGRIYLLAEFLSFPAFHWVAFGLMSAGVVSFALQLVLGKLSILFRGSISIREILSDAAGFVVSSVGLVLTTQAAAENSTFTHSPASVLSSAIAGIVLGFMMYRWGQAQELEALAGRRLAKKKADS
jgi:hypothetical protein